MTLPPGRASRLLVAVVVLSFALAACGGSSAPKTKSAQRGMTEDIGGLPEEQEFKEVEVELPPYPADARMVEFKARQNGDLRYFIDRESVSLAADRVVRYAVVARSPSGALTVSFEGLRCKTSEYKVYAFGTANEKWKKSPDPKWRPISRLSGDFRFALYKDYFCDIEAVAGRNAKDLVANLTGNPLNNVTDKNR